MIKKLFRFIFGVLALAGAGLAIYMMMNPLLTSTFEKSGIGTSYTLFVSGFVLAFGGKATAEYRILSGDINKVEDAGTIEAHTAALILFIILVVAATLSLALFLFSFAKGAKGAKRGLGFLCFLAFIGAAVLFFLSKQLYVDIAEFTILGNTIDFSENLTLANGAIIGGVSSAVAGVTIAVSSLMSD